MYIELSPVSDFRRWSEWWGSNPRPRGPKPRALSTELHPDIGTYLCRRTARRLLIACKRPDKYKVGAWRGRWDSNPRPFRGPVFKTGAFDLSATSAYHTKYCNNSYVERPAGRSETSPFDVHDAFKGFILNHGIANPQFVVAKFLSKVAFG